MALNKKLHLPPGIGEDLKEPLLFNPYQQLFQAIRRLRICMHCQKTQSIKLLDGSVVEASGATGQNGIFTCPFCNTHHVSNITAPRLFDKLLVLAGRQGGKTKIGAHAVREELMIPGSLWWAMGPTYKILWDSTFPALVRLIPPDWVKRWDPEHQELTLLNDSKVAFRSLEDPERARGPQGVSGGWFDEAAQCPERAYDVFEPTLIKAAGIVICTTTVLGYDWTYDKIEKRAMTQQPGYWFTRFWTEENPLFASSPVMKRKIEQAKATMTPEFYAQEYKAERRNAEGLIYDYKRIEQSFLADDDAIRKVIPEWPNINPERPVLVGLDSGVDHPFGSVMIVVTEKGLVVVDEYLERKKALTEHIVPIRTKFFNVYRYAGMSPLKPTWAANKNEANLRLEFALKNIDVFCAESRHEIGIQRVQAWILTGQLLFAYTVPRTIEQMMAYRYANNQTADGQKKDKESVFKKKDELPDALRYAIMAWPELPEAKMPERTESEQKRWEAFDEKTRQDLDRMKDYEQREREKDINPDHPLAPIGEFFGHVDNLF